MDETFALDLGTDVVDLLLEIGFEPDTIDASFEFDFNGKPFRLTVTPL